MAVAFDGTNISQAESETDGGTWDKWGATQSPTQETDFVIQNTYAISNKISSGTGGVDFDATTAVDYSTTPKIVIARVMTSVPAVINTGVAEGLSYQVGSSGSDYYNYYLFGSRKDYPLDQSWLSLVIDPNIAGYRDATTGTPALGTVDYYGLYINTSASVKAENIIHDTLNYTDVGTGLTWTGTGGSYQDFIDYDEGTQNNRQGVVTTKGKAIFCYATLTIGSATATTFTDTNKQVFYPDGLYDAGTVGHSVDLGNASSAITLNNMVYVGEGRGAIIADFHTNTDVDGTNEELDIVAHGFETGDYVDYSKQGGTDVMGLTDGNDYWVEAVTVDSISLHTTRANAFTGTTPVNLTASGGSETHRLTKLTDTRPDFIVSNTTGTADLDGNNYLNHRNITFTSAASQTGGRIECKLLTQNSADIDNLTIVTSSDPSVAALQDPTFGTTTDLHDVDFVQTSDDGVYGHAIELSTVGGTYTLTNITFTDYGATASDQAAIDVTAASGTTTINVSGGTSPTYKTAGATVSIVLNPVSQAVNVKDVDGTDLQNVRVFVETAATIASGEMFEAAVTSLTQSAGTATCTTTAVHGLATNDYVVIRGAQPDGYNKVAQVTVSSTTVFTYTVDSGLSSPATGTPIVSFVPVYGLTDVNGDISASRTWAAAQQLKGWARKKNTTSPFYKDGDFAYTVDTTNGNSTNVVLQPDE